MKKTLKFTDEDFENVFPRLELENVEDVIPSIDDTGNKLPQGEYSQETDIPFFRKRALENTEQKGITFAPVITNKMGLPLSTERVKLPTEIENQGLYSEPGVDGDVGRGINQAWNDIKTSAFKKLKNNDINLSQDTRILMENQGVANGELKGDGWSENVASAAAYGTAGGIINAGVGIYQSLTGEGAKAARKIYDYNGTDGEQLKELFNAKSEADKSETLNKNNIGYKLLQLADDSRKIATEELTPTGEFLTNTVISALQNAYFMPLAPVSIALPLAGLTVSAAGQTMYEQTQKGKGLNEAVFRGIVDGSIEAATEKMGVDSLVKIAMGTGKGPINEMFKSMMSEAGEEGLSYVAGWLVDIAQRDPEAEFSLQDLSLALLGGALSGGMLSGGGYAFGKMTGTSQKAGTTEETDGENRKLKEYEVEGIKNAKKPDFVTQAAKKTSLYHTVEQADRAAAESAKIRADAEKTFKETTFADDKVFGKTENAVEKMTNEQAQRISDTKQLYNEGIIGEKELKATIDNANKNIKQTQLRQAAVNSGLENDIKNIEELAKTKGKKVIFFSDTNENAPEGFNCDGDIYVNTASQAPMFGVAVHEIGHNMVQNTTKWNSYKSSITNVINSSSLLTKYAEDVRYAYGNNNSAEVIKSISDENGNISAEKLEEEVILKVTQKILPQIADRDSELLDKIKKDRNLVDGLLDFIRGIKNKVAIKLTGSQKAMLDEAERTLVNLMRGEGQSGGGEVRYSVNENFEKDINNWYSNGKTAGETFILGSTSDVLQGLGAIENSIYMLSDKINNILKRHPEMSIEEIKKIPQVLENPIMILKSRNVRGGSRNTRVVAFSSIKDIAGQPMAVVLDLRPIENKIVIDDMQKLTSAYGKETGNEDFLKDSEVMYLSGNKKITKNLISHLASKAPNEFQQFGYIGNISYNKRNVNLSGVPFNEVFGENESQNKQFSLKVDSHGNELSEQQHEYFKKSKVRDTNGNLKVMYHGTPNGTFTKFKSGTYFTENQSYANNYQNVGASSLGVKRSADAPKTYEVYLNMTKPFDTRNKTERNIFMNEYYRQWGTGTPLMDSGLPDWLDGMDLQEFLEENEYDYDGLILDEGGTGGYGDEAKKRGLSYVIFDANQVKNIDNTVPTNDADIRFSLKINDKEQKYTTRRDIADYNENSYNKRGWAILNDVLGKNEVASFFSKLTGTYLEKGKDGLYIVPVGDKFGVNNKLIFTDGKFKNPSVEKVIEINLDSETDIEIVRDFIYEQEDGKWSRTSNVIESFNESGILRELRLRDFESFQEFRRRRNIRQADNLNNQQQRDRGGDIGKAESAVKTISDTINDTTKDTSLGGSFSLSTDSSEKMSGMDAKSRNIERGTVNQFLNETANMFGVPYSEKNGELKKMAWDIADRVEKFGFITAADMNNFFEMAYENGRQLIVDGKEYKELKNRIRTVGIEPVGGSEYIEFLHKYNGKVRFKRGGRHVDSLYAELSQDFPEFFSVDIENPYDQMWRLGEVYDSISDKEVGLDEYYGKNAKIAKEEMRSEYEKNVDLFVQKLNSVNRYRGALALQRAKEQTVREKYLDKIYTVDDVTACNEAAKPVRREISRLMKYIAYTSEDKAAVEGMLCAKSDRVLEALKRDINDNNPNAENVINLYELKKKLANILVPAAEYNRQVRENRKTVFRELLTTAAVWKDKKTGLSYKSNTFERNIRDIVTDKEAAEKLIDILPTSIHKHVAQATRYKNLMRNKIRALNIDNKTKYKVEFLDEGGNVISGELTESGLVQAYGEGLINKKYLDTLGVKTEKIVSMAEMFRKTYNEILEEINKIYIQNGYRPIEYREDYFPHFIDDGADSVLTKITSFLGMDAKNMLPTEINGKTQDFNPGRQWNSNALQREGTKTTYDALKGFDNYIEVAANVIHLTGDIQNLRAFEDEIRYKFSADNIKQSIDNGLAEINELDISEDDKAKLKKALFENMGSKTTLNNFVVWLHDYTNVLAGKKSDLDRTFESLFGRGFYKAVKNIENRIAGNMVAANVGSALTNFMPISQMVSETHNPKYLINALNDTVKNMFVDDDFSNMSDFITNRNGSELLSVSKMDKLSIQASLLMTTIDEFTANFVVRSMYIQNINEGMSHNDAMQNADEYAANLMADRSKGALPLIFESKNPLIKPLTMFQLESLNQLKYLVKDLPRKYQDRAFGRLLLAYLGYSIFTWLYGFVYKRITGREMSGSVIDVVYDVGKNIYSSAKGDMKASEAIKESTIRIAEEIPFSAAPLALSGISDNAGRLPVGAALPNWGNLTTIFNGDVVIEKRLEILKKELAKPFYYLMFPFGGGQVKKTVEGVGGLMAKNDGVSYRTESDGSKRVQFVTDTSNPLKWAQAATFGKWSTSEARGYIENGQKPLNKMQTQVFEYLRGNGVRPKEAYARAAAIKTEVDTNKNGSFTHEEVKAWLNGKDGLTQNDRAQLFDTMCPGAKVNPYRK